MSNTSPAQRETFSKRSVFILAAIGSAIGLGSIWRFPYVAYQNGGGAFLIPFLIALLTAGIPMLFLDYAMGHRFRGGAPLTFRRFAKHTETLGWFQVAICFVIPCYYSVIIAWSCAYMVYSVKEAWGNNPAEFFNNDFLQSQSSLSVDFVPAVLIPLIIVWVITIGTLALGVQNGVGNMSKFFVPLLAALFLILVVRSLFLSGASDGLEVFFHANWNLLSDGKVWIAAYSQIFFSLSVGYGIMITYSSYLKRRTDLAGSSLVVAFATTSFQVLAGICVFAALGFLAHQQGTSVDSVAANGIGLAFIAFPSVISQMHGGPIFGVLFFLSLVLAGLTSSISLVEVVAAAFQDKFGLRRVPAVLITGIPMAIISIVLFATTSGVNVLSVVDKFINNAIALNALVTLILISWVYRRVEELHKHLISVSSLPVGKWWNACISIITPVALVWMLFVEFSTIIRDGYEDHPTWFLVAFGWGSMIFALVFAIILALCPWSDRIVHLDGPVFTPELTTEYQHPYYREWLAKHHPEQLNAAPTTSAAPVETIASERQEETE